MLNTLTNSILEKKSNHPVSRWILKQIICIDIRANVSRKQNRSRDFSERITAVLRYSRHICKFLACTWRHEILKYKIKELPKILSSWGRRGANFISVYNFLAQQHASFGNQRILNFRVVAVRDINLDRVWQKNIYLSRYFLAIWEVKTLRKVSM